jgi:hypothetical protein
MRRPKALLELGAKDVSLLDAHGAERRVPVEQLQSGERERRRQPARPATKLSGGVLRLRGFGA